MTIIGTCAISMQMFFNLRIYSAIMNLPGFCAEYSLEKSKSTHLTRLLGVTVSKITLSSLQLSSLVQLRQPVGTCYSTCYATCESDPDLRDYNNCGVACRCQCSGHLGCWQ